MIQKIYVNKQNIWQIKILVETLSWEIKKLLVDGMSKHGRVNMVDFHDVFKTLAGFCEQVVELCSSQLQDAHMHSSRRYEHP